MGGGGRDSATRQNAIFAQLFVLSFCHARRFSDQAVLTPPRALSILPRLVSLLSLVFAVVLVLLSLDRLVCQAAITARVSVYSAYPY